LSTFVKSEPFARAKGGDTPPAMASSHRKVG